jgi:hypothetical protein
MPNHEANDAPTSSSPWDLRFGGTLAVLAAFLAVNDLGGGKYGGDELQWANEKNGAYNWYQSKGIKETLAEGQRDLLKVLLEGGVISESARPSLEKRAQELNADANRYGKEKKEILLGSKAVGQENWAQDIDGKLGMVVGANDYENAIETLGHAGDRFDLANLFLQLSLVLGAIGIIMSQASLKKFFFAGMVLLGLMGTVFSALAFCSAGFTLRARGPLFSIESLLPTRSEVLDREPIVKPPLYQGSGVSPHPRASLLRALPKDLSAT